MQHFSTPYNVRYRPDQGPQSLGMQQGPLGKPTMGGLVAKTLGSGAMGGFTGALVGSSLGVLGGIGVGLVGGLGTAALTYHLTKKDAERRAEFEGQRYYADRAYRRSSQMLEDPMLSLQGRVAHTMRQQMLQTLHNSAYYGRQVIGREAEILHA